jgi:SAM-dependent methyltransferase
MEADLATYYDQDAIRRAGRDLDPERIARRTEFLALLRAEGRRTVLEIGTGPGRDALAFLAAGLEVTGIDLSAEHVRLARELGVDAHQASVLRMPFAGRSFSAGWTMSTLLHIPDAQFDAALDAIVARLEDGAPLAVGLWGGRDQEGVSERDTLDPPRFFSRRSHERIQAMLGRAGRLERFQTWGDSAGGWQYQWALLRVDRRGRRDDAGG